MNAFERFIAKSDALSRLISSQPAFAPTPEQEARLLSAIAAIPQATSASLEFEPPAGMEAAFLQQARTIAEAQAPRRDALLDRLQHGESSEAVLGHSVSQATQDWLTTQQAAPAAPATPVRQRMHWWQWGGLIVVPALVAGIGFQLLFPAQRELPANLAVFESASAPQTAPLQLAENATPVPVAAELKKKTHPAEVATRSLQLADSLSAPAGAMPTKPAAPVVMAAAPPAPVAELKLEQPAIEQESAKMAAEHLAMNSAKERAAPAPAMLARSKGLVAAEEAPQPAAKPVMAKKAASVRPGIFRLSDDPNWVAAELPSSQSGYLVRVSDPDDPAVQAWLAKFRQARRGHAAIRIESDSSLPSGQLFITLEKPEAK